MLRSRQLGFRFRTWGGARAGAGRRPNGKVAGVAHLRRPLLDRNQPLHVTLRVRPGLGSLREHGLFRRVRAALAEGRERFGFRMVQFSVQRDHLHLIAEAADRRALSRGVQGLSIRVARAVNQHLGRRGSVFDDRYHARALRSPREVRLALRYVLLNARKHARRAGGSSVEVPFGFVDSCSSAPWFADFVRTPALVFGAERCRAEFARGMGTTDPPVVRARTWLLRVGYRRSGGFDIDDLPGARS